MIDERAHARRGDPSTSHAAADSVVALTATRRAILDALETYGPMTDAEIAIHYDGPRASPSGLRTRRAELVRAGEVIATTERRLLDSGRYAVVWASANDLRLF